MVRERTSGLFGTEQRQFDVLGYHSSSVVATPLHQAMEVLALLTTAAVVPGNGKKTVLKKVTRLFLFLAFGLANVFLLLNTRHAIRTNQVFPIISAY